MEVNIAIQIDSNGQAAVDVQTQPTPVNEVPVASAPASTGEVEVLLSLARTGKRYAKAQLRRYPGNVLHIQLDAPGVPGGNRGYGNSFNVPCDPAFLDMLDRITGVQS